MERVREWARGRDVAICYAVILVAVALTLALAPPAWRENAVAFSSTNLSNMRRRPLVALALSAFILPSTFALIQVPLVLIVFGAVQRRMGRLATIIAAGYGHAGASLLVTVLLITGITRGLVDRSVRSAADVGISYALIALAGLYAVWIDRTRLKWLYVLAMSLLLTLALMASKTFTDLGHLIAWLIGLGTALIVAGARRRNHSGGDGRLR